MDNCRVSPQIADRNLVVGKGRELRIKSSVDDLSEEFIRQRDALLSS